jgi:predicted component of type VI protein secretion system
MPVILTPLDDGEPVALDKAIVFFGRHPDCDVVLTNSRKVSRKHCCIAQINNDFVVRDLGSMNGVRINGKPAGKEARIKLGDEIWVGDVRYRMEVGKIEKKSPAREQADPGVRRVDPELLSRDVPVAIPEEGADFIVEETRPRMKKPDAPKKKGKPAKEEEIIILSEDDIIE